MLRSHNHRETGNTVQHYTSKLDAVAEFGVYTMRRSVTVEKEGLELKDVIMIGYIRALVEADVASNSSKAEEGKTYSLQLAIVT